MIHLNDSKFPLGAGKDRHEVIGKGYIGMDGDSGSFSPVKRYSKSPGFWKLPAETPTMKKRSST
jgi:deoxyribonuclease-4